MEDSDDYIGKIALSLAGRDKDKFAAVIGVVDENYVLIADGRLRKCEAPKKKKLKHLKFVCKPDGTAMEINKQKLTNRYIREGIRYFLETGNNQICEGE